MVFEVKEWGEFKGSTEPVDLKSLGKYIRYADALEKVEETASTTNEYTRRRIWVLYDDESVQKKEPAHRGAHVIFFSKDMKVDGINHNECSDINGSYDHCTYELLLGNRLNKLDYP